MQAGRQAAACTAWTVFSLVSSTHSADTVKTLPVNIKLANTQTHCHTHTVLICMSTHRDTAAECFIKSACHLDFGLGKIRQTVDPSSCCEEYRETVI